MSLPRFVSRIQDSLGPLLSEGNAIGSATRAFLESKHVRIETTQEIENQSHHIAGLHLLVNLVARLYPRITVRAPTKIAEDCRTLALQINPQCEFFLEDPRMPAPESAVVDGVVCWAVQRSTLDACVVAPVGWDVVIDEPEAMQLRSTNVLTALAAAAIAAGELFRTVFASKLPKGRRQPLPSRFNVLTYSQGSGGAALPELPSNIALGRVHLVGAGAVGQAAIYALARVSATGIITVIDAEDVTVSNLQRYVLSMDSDVGTSKCDLVARALGTTRLDVLKVKRRWDVEAPEIKGAQVLCAAVDSAALRIALQSALPERLYNAWTQPEDIGWSRHEHFGADPCLACLYWPTSQRPSYHEQVAKSLRQDPLRVLTYLVHKIPVDSPLMIAQIPRIGGAPLPPQSDGWTKSSLLADIAAALGVTAADSDAWRGKLLPDLYTEGICGGALLRSENADVPGDMAVPLAHQSVLAGIMLACELVFGARSELASLRGGSCEARLDLLAGFPQVAPRPRKRTEDCICSDRDFLARYAAKWPYAATAGAAD